MSLVATAIVAVSFACFCADGLGAESSHQVQAIDRSAPAPSVEQQRERAHGRLRELVDDADDVLVGPFVGGVRARSPWVARAVPALLAVFVYGILLRWLAGRLGEPGPAGRGADRGRRGPRSAGLG